MGVTKVRKSCLLIYCSKNESEIGQIDFFWANSLSYCVFLSSFLLDGFISDATIDNCETGRWENISTNRR